MGKGDRSRWSSVGILAILWAIAAIVDRLWLWFDRSIPSWDPADHLIGALNYGWTLQNAQWFSGEWWRGLWMLSSKYPPLLYISTAPVLRLVGTEADAAVLINLGFTAVLLGSVYGLGKRLLNAELGLWAAGLCLLFPRFYTVRTQYFMDYPLVALVALSFLCLTIWRDAKTTLGQWGWAIAFGSSFGLALLMKQSALFFLVVPLLWVGIAALGRRQWGRVAQMGVASVVAIAFLFPWLRQNWLFQISAGFNSNIKSALSEGDPPLHTLGAWTYYAQDLPAAVSLPLVVMAIAGLLWMVLKPQRHRVLGEWRSPSSWIWLGGFVVGAYGIWSAVLNKDERYTMPYLPIVALFLAYGLLQWRGRWVWIRWATVGVTIGVMLLNLFPIGGAIGQRMTRTLSPNAQQHPYTGDAFPHAAVMEEILRAEPYQTANVGTLHSTATLNQHNLTYVGNQRNFQVYGRRVGNLDRHLEQDVRSMDWILTKTGKDGSDSGKTRRQRAGVMKQVRQDGEFRRQQVWTLPGGDRLFLFHRRTPAVRVRPLDNASIPSAVRLQRVKIPASAPPGEPIPITYEWTGNWQQLHDGLVLVTWQAEASSSQAEPFAFWQDHAIGLGRLHPGAIQANQIVQAAAIVEPTRLFQVIERTAMLPPATTIPGVYRLTLTYVDRQSGETYAIPAPPTRLTIDPQASATPAPVLDWVTQLRTIAASLAEGSPALEAAFDQIDRLNLYDPNQSYTVQAEDSMQLRLQIQPTDRTAAYTLALAQVLQRDVPGAIAALERVAQLDAQNPNAHAYLGFINLYGFRPRAAEQALRQARALDANSAEIQGLSAIAALMRGNLRQAWDYGQAALALQPKE
ncbi:MAG: phospholipid carrier-dependent glycosyltransferase [Leptolyngbyaceae cyanobacterium SL_7_1]|nr:phospholipid carrier-dependent glycosyltransferase [Leptolyngbyaceae cyanobacterium SL_7_1]